ncbi:MAG: FAD-dependent oxidoreductase [Kiritimatiellae bacterium]|nr:FAD-dependent oxidoreductase [Kiritimatiellia bacterium]
MQKLTIIGSGPAGLSAGIYAARGGVKPVVLEGLESGGQLMQTQHVANYPGFPGVAKGPDIIAAIRRQAEEAGVAFVMDAVKSVDFSGGTKKLMTLMGDTIETQAVIIASGAGVTKTDLPGEAKYFGRGISACLTCDGAFYAGKRAVVVGEGPASAGAKVYLERLGATVPAIVKPSDAAEFTGDGPKFTGVKLKDGTSVAADGAFLVTARTPQTSFVAGALELDAKGHVVTSGGVKTAVPGVFAAGDCARPKHKQAVIAAGDGALAALEALEYLRTH